LGSNGSSHERRYDTSRLDAIGSRAHRAGVPRRNSKKGRSRESLVEPRARKVRQMSDGDKPPTHVPTVTYDGDGWFESPFGGFGIHGDYEVVLVPVAIFERLELPDVRQALVAANAAGDFSALEWFLTDEPDPHNIYDPGVRDAYSFALQHEHERVVVRIRTGRWVDPDDPQRATILMLFAPFDERRGTKTDVLDDEHENMAVEITVPGGVGSAAMRIGEEAVALLGALDHGGITLEVAAGLLRAGMAELLLGQRESAWLDAKKQPYRLSDERHKLELAKDVAAFANGVGRSDRRDPVWGAALRNQARSVGAHQSPTDSRRA
jgi:hypothetical protein